MPSGRQPQETGFCGVCDEDHQAEFAQFAHPTEKALPADLKGFGGPNGIEDRDGRVCWSLDKDKQMNHAVDHQVEETDVDGYVKKMTAETG